LGPPLSATILVASPDDPEPFRVSQSLARKLGPAVPVMVERISNRGRPGFSVLACLCVVLR
jgi:hypothetical protein